MKINVISEKGRETLVCAEGESLLDAMKRQDIYVPAYCGGRGSCGKCKIQLQSGELPVTKEDAKVFSKEELEAGMRLSCKAYPKEDCTIRLCVQNESDFEILGAGSSPDSQGPSGKAAHEAGSSKDSSYGIAVDIGTTTIAMELLELARGDILAQSSRINHQRAYGADVISRIEASVKGEGENLRRFICSDLLEGMEELLAKGGIDAKQVIRLVIGANTTMGHLLLGYPCDTLGVAPFTPYNIRTVELTFGELMQGMDISSVPMEGASVYLLPGISTYVGADIVAGLLVCGFDTNTSVSMLIDLGTNGEMAIGNGERRIATSTAAGPAFEGGNITCGTGSVGGAICSVHLTEEGMTYETIGGKAPVGICGTGVLDITAELVAHELVDETGLLDEDYFDEGVEIATGAGGEKIIFSQKDVREIQLAKAAVRAGIEVLMKHMDISMSDLDRVYLAGGFGFRLDVEKAIAIGLLPEGFKDKVEVVGNTSLLGARACLLDLSLLQVAARLGADTQEISLGSDPYFNQCYMDAMYFE